MKNPSVVILLLCFFVWSCKKEMNRTHDENAVAPLSVQATATLTSTAAFKGGNWADPNDNFADGAVVPSGLSTGDDYATTKAKASNILAYFQQQGINTVRMPVNPPSVLQSWWGAYTGAIDDAVGKGMNVILCYWEGASSRDGIVDNLTDFWNMWQTITSKYGNTANVYFEVFNEPHGYSTANLNNLYAQWLTNYPAIPHGRVLLDGVGYATDVNAVGADSRLNTCLLSYHNYTWFDNNKTTVADWEAAIESLAYPDRTIVTEFGIPMTNGKDYLGAPGSDREIAYFQGMTNRVRARGLGCVYWPALRNGDGYSLFTLSGTTLTVNNTSGLSRLQYAWGGNAIAIPLGSFDSNAWYKIVCRQSNKGLDVNGSSTANGGNIVQWDYWGGNNQQWKITSVGGGYSSVMNRNSGKALDVNGISTAGGANIIQWDYWGGANQQWQIIDIGFGYYEVINKNSSQSLDVNGGSTANGAGIIQWYLNGGRNQQWLIQQL